jgi:5-(carboxyamino)imidazole ribonucleotide mutase
VATVAINGAENAALLAIRILAVADPILRGQLDAHRADLAAAAQQQDSDITSRLA